jgi:hypothetical protein
MLPIKIKAPLKKLIKNLPDNSLARGHVAERRTYSKKDNCCLQYVIKEYAN